VLAVLQGAGGLGGRARLLTARPAAPPPAAAR